MNILVTGGAGFVGKNLCSKLLQKNHRVGVIDNFITSSKVDFKGFLELENLKLFEGDVCDLNLIKKIQKLYQFDQIYHLACPTGVPNIEILGFEMLMACSIGTKNILDLARIQKAQVLFTSSSEVYGDPEVFPQSETYTGNVDPIGPRSPYEEGKRFSESLVKMYCHKYGLEAKIVRLFNTYGPFMSIKDTRVIPKFIQSALKGKPLPVKGQGRQKRTFMFVSDLVAGLEIVMKKGKRGEVYNLGSEKQVSIVELAKKIIKLTDSKSKIKLIPREAHDHQARLPDLKKITNLGWESKVDLKQGLEKTLKSI